MVAQLTLDELEIRKSGDDRHSWYKLFFNDTLITEFVINNYNIYIPDYSEHIPVLINFRTKNEFQRMGYGKYLLTSVMKERKFILSSYKESEEFYRKCGLKEVHTNFHYTIFENLT